ncbi:glycerol-3-phosphate dehydrogenase [Cohnella kolymensis]|uniref:Glycerol-3-phosphate dehydrogenase n=1 Tax=Cohnella kolymensis TaxID=1590652 RepID=A0ABR5A9G6_9BACL|nr:glycerol-3-phosphate dehydrogenase/oxidase [Cohnella kolymensis]KIL37644.1 glycerol-3-phosphate dehydrogenase [Cohnella kolymensis]
MDRLPFSVFDRLSHLEKMSEQTLDLLVIGGGITGAGIALDAASRGLSVGLVEKQDFGAGTSSRSTKLIHGGLRYLKQGEVKLVREVGRERAILHRNAPHLVIPEKMLLPLVIGGTYGKLATSFGLWLYDILAGVKREERRVMLSQAQAGEAEPLLRTDILKGGGLYIEYRTDDARLTIEVMKTAVQYGAMCVNYTEAAELLYRDGKIAGFEARDLLTQKTFNLSAKRVVNAAGPWADELREKDRSLRGKSLHLTKGVHLVVPYDKFPLQQSVYFDVPDGRMIFAIPRGKCTYFGTTDTDYRSVIEHPRVTREDAAYLINAVNRMFPSLNLSQDDICSSWAGLRPLIHEDGKSPSELSRKDEIFLSPSGLITIAGGKLTGYRKMAERVVNMVAEQLEQEEQISLNKCYTDRIVLSGGDFLSPESVSAYIEQLAARHSQQLSRQLLVDLVRSFGTNSEKILELSHSFRETGTEMNPATALLFAELQYCIQEEMTVSLTDFLIRRTGMLLFDRQRIEEVLPMVADELANKLEWESERKSDELQRLFIEYDSAVTFH